MGTTQQRMYYMICDVFGNELKYYFFGVKFLCFARKSRSRVCYE